MFALDTNAVIHFFKGKGNVAARLLATPPGEVALPSVVVFELERGIRKHTASEDRITRLARFIAAVQILPFDHRAAELAAEISVRLEAAGKAIGPLDLLIAATARAHGVTLVTHNTDEFSRVPGLALEDWFL